MLTAKVLIRLWMHWLNLYIVIFFKRINQCFNIGSYHFQANFKHYDDYITYVRGKNDAEDLGDKGVTLSIKGSYLQTPPGKYVLLYISKYKGWLRGMSNVFEVSRNTVIFLNLSHVMGKPVFGFPTRSNTKRAVQLQKIA